MPGEDDDNEVPPRRDLILATVGDLVGDLLYYDRHDDEELPFGSFGLALAAGEITVDEIVAHFRETFVEGLKDDGVP